LPFNAQLLATVFRDIPNDRSLASDDITASVPV
jgi:hypothetical protein